jgi:HSP20 family protein
MQTYFRTPDATLAALGAEVDRWLGDAARAGNGYALTPPADVAETEAAFLVSLDLPGHDPKAISIQVENDTLTISSERKAAEPVAGAEVHRSERRHGTFFRSFALPRTVDGTRVEARCEHGVLTVTLPKRDDARPRTISVQVG